MLYGEYLEAVWAEAQRDAPASSSLSHRRTRVVSARAAADGSRLRVGLADGGHVDADHVVLAMGNLPPGSAGHSALGIAGSARYIADPWRAGALDGVTGPVLLIGTGLTAIDVALMLDERPGVGPIQAVSRHGLLPRSHRPDTQPACGLPVAPPERTARELVELLRRNAVEHGDWRIAVDELRPHVAELWRTAPDAERRRFLRHAARFWEVHRHRMAPEVADRVSDLLASLRLTVMAGSIAGHRDLPDRVEVIVRPRGGTATEALSVAHVINCTGPQLKVSDAGDPFVDSLLAADLVRPGRYGLGFDVAEDGAVIDTSGARSGRLWAIGPLRRGVEWETTAAREIRAQAVALAARLVPAAEATPERSLPPDIASSGTSMPRLMATVAAAVPKHVAGARVLR
jgi:uncharacterized NAD(P)/FAD-binding protein YdhS